eukprot:GFUD01029208.1.p1 GENE.GFUD01029208.1~~GFUD01029208.1.p1  ORF type:complete len:138 (+),score=24.66 GFUD01029208.1:39-452(+)
MRTRPVFSSVFKQPQMLVTRFASSQLKTRRANVHSRPWRGQSRKHVIKISLGTGLGLSGILVNSQLGNLGFREFKKGVVGVENSLMEAFNEDIKKEMGKERLTHENTVNASNTKSTESKVEHFIEEVEENLDIVKSG